MTLNEIIQGDAVEVLKTFPDNFFDSIVCDPPAGISFMSKNWDSDKGGRDQWIKWLSEVFIEAKRGLKPGGHALVWSLPRTSHWTGMALEDAGFEVRDIMHHIFGSGFPKSLNIGKAVDVLKGNKREVIDTRDVGHDITNAGYKDAKSERKIMDITKGTSEWEGWGTALKPAVECWWLVRKPISENTIAENVLKYGCGGLNIDGCRIEHHEEVKTTNRTPRTDENVFSEGTCGFKKEMDHTASASQMGRFPANLTHDGSDDVLAEFPISSTTGKRSKPHIPTPAKNTPFTMGNPLAEYTDSGTAARFFYCAKPSKSERDRGLEGMGMVKGNFHPTVKAQALMQYLIKLITPPDGIVLDMFAGSGSTLIAAVALGHPYIGIEIDPEYCKIARKRIVAAIPIPAPKHKPAPKKPAAPKAQVLEIPIPIPMLPAKKVVATKLEEW